MDKKTLTKWLKGRTGIKKFTAVLLAAGVLLLAGWGVFFTRADRHTPEQYTTSLHNRAYCYMDVQYMTRPFATSEVYGAELFLYCYIADADFNWISVELTNDRYQDFSEIVAWTYDFEDDTPPDPVRLVGSLRIADSDVTSLAREFYKENIAEDENDYGTIYHFTPGGHPDKYRSVLILIPGVVCLVAGLVSALLSFRFRRRRRAGNTITALKKSGELQAAMDDLSGENNLQSRNPLEMSGGNVLGDRFIFLFTEGIIIPYSRAANISLRQKNAQTRTLRVHDDKGGIFPLVSESFSKAGSPECFIDKAVAHIRERNPDCEKI